MYMGYSPSEDDKNKPVLPTAKNLMRKYSEDVKQENRLNKCMPEATHISIDDEMHAINIYFNIKQKG